MTDPIRLQRQLVAATQRADDLERQLAELEERFAATWAKVESAHVDYLRLARVEHALHLGGFSGFAPVGVDVALRATMGDVQAPAALTEGGER